MINLTKANFGKNDIKYDALKPKGKIYKFERTNFLQEIEDRRMHRFYYSKELNEFAAYNEKYLNVLEDPHELFSSDIVSSAMDRAESILIMPFKYELKNFMLIPAPKEEDK